MAGTLFVVATPIGNLEDLTFRALRTLREVDLIAAEDTRRTVKLLAHYEIRKSLASLHQHNEFREAPRLVARLQRGENIALVSDAGTPAVADPGTLLVQLARRAGLPVIPIPGPSAITAALSVAGLTSSEFCFLGFPPPKGAERRRWLLRLSREPYAVVAFEAPHRIRQTLHDIRDILVNRHIIILRELTKVNFELVEWDNGYDPGAVKELGELVVVIGERPKPEISDDKATRAAQIFGYLTDNCLCAETLAFSAVAGALDIDSESAEVAVRLGRKLAKQQKMRAP